MVLPPPFHKKHRYYIMTIYREFIKLFGLLSIFTLITCSCDKSVADEILPKEEEKGKANTDGDIITQNGGYAELSHILQNLKKTKLGSNGQSDNSYSRLLLLTASDIHNDVERLKRMVKFHKTFPEYIDDAFICGDITGSSMEEWTGEFNNVEGFENILLSVGNHDTYKVSGYNQVYSTLFKSNVTNWHVNQPEKAEEQSLCYYYKDYNSAKVRFIVLDGEHWISVDSENQKNWFCSTLEEARKKGYAVLAAVHRPAFTLGNGFNTSFNSLENESFGGDSHALDHMAECVDEFQEKGGEFICWLGGHTHTDYCGVFDLPYQSKDGSKYIKPFPKQIYIIEGSSKQDVVWQDCVKVPESRSQDLLNLLSIDVKSKLLVVYRIGADFDMFGRKKVSMTIDYANHSLLYSN